jgi:glycogen synthase
MKILEIINKFPPSEGGSQKVVHQLAKQFTKQGHLVTVVTSTSINNKDTRGFSTEGIFHLKNSCQPDNYELMSNIKVYRFKPFFKFWPYAYNPSMRKFLKKEVHKYDIVHVHGYQSYEADLVSKLGVPYILTAHDIIAHYRGFLGFLKKIYDIIIGKRILKRAKKLIAITPENVIQYNEIINCNNKIAIVPNGIESFSKKEKSSELLKKLGNPHKTILFFARIVKYKGAQYIIQALPKIIEIEPKIMCVFAGNDQGYKKELVKLAAELKVQNHCIFTGKISNETREDFYNLADVFIFPSTGEGFGLVAAEALHFGIPSILANKGGLKYILKEIGGYPLDMNKDIPLQIFNYVKNIFQDEKIKEKMLPAIENSKCFTWEDIAKKTLKEFQ